MNEYLLTNGQKVRLTREQLKAISYSVSLSDFADDSAFASACEPMSEVCKYNKKLLCNPDECRENNMFFCKRCWRHLDPKYRDAFETAFKK